MEGKTKQLMMKAMDMEDQDLNKALNENVPMSVSEHIESLSDEDIKKLAEETYDYVIKNYPITYRKLGEWELHDGKEVIPFQILWPCAATQQKEFIYRVMFRIPPFQARRDFRTEFFFTSPEAIYTVFTVEQIGCNVSRLWNLKVSDGVPYYSGRCEITREPLVRKPQAKKD